VLFAVPRGRGQSPPSNPLEKEVYVKMVNETGQKPQDRSFYLRKLTKAGGARYLSVGKILPPDWEAVKVYVGTPHSGMIIMQLIQIK